MSNDLAIRLITPIEELIPQMIAFNNDELLAKVEARLKSYEGTVYTDDQIIVAKKDRSELNAVSTMLDNWRKDIKKKYEAPYLQFKAQVDEVINRIKEVSTKIDDRVKEYEKEKAEKKLADIREYFMGAVGEFNGVISYEKIHQPKWLNATTSMKSIKADIDGIVNGAKNAMLAIEALKSEDEAIIKAFYFRSLDLTAALMENDRLMQERERALKAAAPRVEVKEAAKDPEPAITPSVVRTMTVRFEITETYEKLRALKAFLVENEINYTKI